MTARAAALVEVHAAAQKLAEWTSRRDAAIRAASAEGCSQRQIAEAAGLSHPTVATITRTNPTHQEQNR